MCALKNAACVVLLFALAACQSVHVGSQSPSNTKTTDPLVDGDLFDPNAATQSNTSIAYIEGAGGCTATLIAPQVLLTAGHCALGSGSSGKTFFVAFPAPVTAKSGGFYKATHTIEDYPVFVTAAHDVVAHPQWMGCLSDFKETNVGDAFNTQCADGFQEARGKPYLEDLCDSMRSGITSNDRLAGRDACESSQGHLTYDGMVCALLDFSIMLQPVNRDAYRENAVEATFNATYASDMLALRDAIIPAREDVLHSESVVCSVDGSSTSRVGFDIALIKLDKPMPPEVRPERVLNQCSTQQVLANTPVFVAGFGATVTDILWRAEFQSELNPVEQEKPFGLYTGTGLVDAVSEHLLAIQGGRFYNMPGQCPGDSGGPVMLDASEGNPRVVIGVASTSRELFGFCLLGAEYTRVQPHSDWIKNTVASFRDAEIKAHPENASAIASAFAMEIDACCGDGMINTGELCDDDCPVGCDDADDSTQDTLWDGGTCQARCVHAAVEVSPRSGGSDESDQSEKIGKGCNTTGSNSLGCVCVLPALCWIVRYRRRIGIMPIILGINWIQ